MLPKKQESKKEKKGKGLLSFFKSKKKEKGKNNLSEGAVSDFNSAELGETSTLKTQVPNKATEKKTILLIGSTGKGKSTLANVLVDEEGKFEQIFKESSDSTSKTREIEKGEFTEDGISYAVIDTVGIGDAKLKKEEVLDKIAEAVYLARKGVSQVFFVISKKFDSSEIENYDLLRAIIFDNEIINHTTIVRTKFGGFKSKEECEKDINLMLEKGGKLAEIIESCQRKVVYVDNPSLNLLPATNESEDRRKKREEKILRGKESRSKSREILLEHLKKVCQEDAYQPSKLQKLNSVIADYMEQKMKKRKELKEKRKKLGLEIKKDQKTKTTETSDQLITVVSKIDSKNVFQADAKNNKQQEEKTSTDEKISLKKRITTLRGEIKELEEVKELKKEIAEKEQIIRRKVLKHILANYNEIIEVAGDSDFINNIGLSKLKVKDIEDNSKVEELLGQLEELEKSSENKEDLMILFLEEIETEAKKREQELIELNKQLLNVKEISENWQKQGFTIQQTNEWVEVLKGNFNLETDAGFCAWLRDHGELTAEKIKELIQDFDIEELRKEYAQYLEKETEELLNKEEDWKEIHEDFKYFRPNSLSNIYFYKKAWKDHGFDYQTTKEWKEEALGESFTVYDWAFCAWLRDEKNLTAQEVKQQGNAENLRTEYNKLWTEIHLDFSKKEDNYSRDKTYQQHWEESGLVYQDAQEWILAGFEPGDYEEVNHWKNHNFTPQEAKSWREIGLKPNYQMSNDAEFAAYLRYRGHQPSEGLKQNLDKLKEEFTTAQNYLDYFFPKNQREEITELDLFQKDLTGSLDLNDFVNLKKLSLNNHHYLASLNLKNCSELEWVRCGDNSLTELVLPDDHSNLKLLHLWNNDFHQDLSFLEKAVNLENLWLQNNKFYGSLEYLKKMKKLKELRIGDTDIDSGLEYLSESLERIECSTEKKPGAKVAKIAKILEPYKDDEYKYYSFYKFQEWRRDYFKYLESKIEQPPK